MTCMVKQNCMVCVVSVTVEILNLLSSLSNWLRKPSKWKGHVTTHSKKVNRELYLEEHRQKFRTFEPAQYSGYLSKTR